MAKTAERAVMVTTEFVVDNDKYASLKREIIAEVVPNFYN
jgi:hypothetical protein